MRKYLYCLIKSGAPRGHRPSCKVDECFTKLQEFFRKVVFPISFSWLINDICWLIQEIWSITWSLIHTAILSFSSLLVLIAWPLVLLSGIISIRSHFLCRPNFELPESWNTFTCFPWAARASPFYSNRIPGIYLVHLHKPFRATCQDVRLRWGRQGPLLWFFLKLPFSYQQHNSNTLQCTLHCIHLGFNLADRKTKLVRIPW